MLRHHMPDHTIWKKQTVLTWKLRPSWLAFTVLLTRNAPGGEEFVTQL